MNGGRRAYDILRGYINHEWERIQNVESSDAQRELDDSLNGPQASRQSSSPKVERTYYSEEQRARMILGVSEGATFEEIRTAYDRLHERSNADNFPKGSTEAEQAEKIQTRVQHAYRLLTEKFDTTETRFKSLEID